MEVLKLVWWQHNSPNGDLSSAKVHRSLKVDNSGSVSVEAAEGPKAEIIDGF
jgi:CRISPR-associated protein Csd2